MRTYHIVRTLEVTTLYKIVIFCHDLEVNQNILVQMTSNWDANKLVYI